MDFCTATRFATRQSLQCACRPEFVARPAVIAARRTCTRGGRRSEGCRPPVMRTGPDVITYDDRRPRPRVSPPESAKSGNSAPARGAVTSGSWPARGSRTEMMFPKTCCSRPASPSTIKGVCASLNSSARDLAVIACALVSTAECTSADKSCKCRSSFIVPCAIRLTSSRSSTMGLWSIALRRMASAARCTCAMS